jgi:branched-chain amino acid transport system substrate-binding protein
MKRRHLIQGACASLTGLGLASGIAKANGRLRVGIPLPFTGVQSEVANDLRSGYEMAFAQAGRLGLAIEPVWADDLAQPDRTALLIDGFARDPSFVAATGIVGTPHAKAALPLARRGALPVVGIRSGAVELRDGKPGVYHLRASFSDELTAMVRVISGATLQRLAVVFSDDAFGKAAMAHVAQIAPTLGVSVVSSVPAERSGKDILGAVDRALEPRLKAGALLLLVIEGPMLRAAEHARMQRQFLHPLFCMSFAATRRLADAKDSYLEGLGLVSAFPLPRTALSPLAEGFRAVAADWHRPGVVNSLTSFEGYLYGSVLLRALQQAPELSRKGLVESMGVPRSVGGVPVAFDAQHVGFRYLQLLHKSRGGVLRA